MQRGQGNAARRFIRRCAPAADRPHDVPFRARTLAAFVVPALGGRWPTARFPWRSAMMSSLILIALAAAAPVPVNPPGPLSPAEAMNSIEAWLHPSTVKLRVAEVTKRADNWVLVADAELEGRDRFEVELSPAVI